MFLDTSVIVEIFKNEPGSQKFDDIYDIICTEPLYVSVAQMGEIASWCIREGYDITDHVNILNKIAKIVDVNDLICIKASMMKSEMRKKGIDKFGYLDGIVLCSAQFHRQKLLTTDSDFRLSDYAIVIQAQQ